MLLTPEEIVAITGTAFVYEIRNTKCRQHGNSMGTLKMYQDRFEWSVDDDPNGVVISVPYETVDMLRVSSPEKPKVQFQACLNVGESVTFQFADPSKNKEQLLNEQKKARDQLQELLVRHRKLVNTQEKNISKSAVTENESKKQLLKKSWVMKILYQNLVVNNTMPPDEFWRLYYKPHESFFEQPGVSNGFMFEVAGRMCASGVKMNLTNEIIRQIFKTYPAIERKYVEYVPSIMTEQEFWSKFLESHYFNRDRVPEFKRNDPFTECLEEDEAHIEASARKKVGAVRKDKDLLSINDDDWLYSNRPELFNPQLSDKKKLIRRLNDFSDRILETALDPTKNGLVGEHPSTSHEQPKNEVDAHVHNFTDLEGEHDEIVLEEDPVRAYEFYVKKPGIAEAEAANEKVKETILPEDLEYPDQELMIIDQEGIESDPEMGYEPARLGRNVPERFKQLEIPLDFFDDLCDEVIHNIEATEDGEEDDALCMEDLTVAKKIQHSYSLPVDEKAFPPLSGYLIQKLFTAHLVVFELSTQLRKLISLKTSRAAKQALGVASALTAFQKNSIPDLRDECNRELGRNGEKITDYLLEAIKDVLHKCIELKDKVPI